MPIYPLTDRSSGKTYEMPWSRPGSPSQLEAKQYIWEQEQQNTPWNKLKNIGSDIASSPYTRRFLFGSTPEERGSNRKVIGPPDAESSILPNWNSEPDTYAGGFAKSLYKDYLQPLATPSGILGSSGTKPIAPIEAPPPAQLPPARFGTHVGPSPNQTMPIMDGVFREAPTAPGTILPPGPRPLPQITAGPTGGSPFYAGQRSISRNLGDISPSGLTPAEETLSAQIPNRYKPAQPPPRMIEDIGKGPLNTNRIDTSTQPFIKPEATPPPPASPARPFSLVSDADVEFLAKAGDKSAQAEAKLRPSLAERLKSETGSMFVGGTKKKSVNQLPIANKGKAKDWATQRNAARIHGQYAAEDFADLANKPELIDKFEAGDRSGRLADVAKVFDELYKAETAAGIKMRSKENYLRHVFRPDMIDEEIAGGATVVPRNPSFSKSSTFKTFADARAAGKIPKFNDLPSIIADRVRASKVAIADRKFYDYLDATQQLPLNPSKSTLREPASWAFSGPDANNLNTYKENVLGKSPKRIKTAANVAAKTKNIYLAGGIPGTPLNIHGYNIVRSQYMSSGMKGIGDFMKGVFNPKGDVAYVKSERDLIKKAIDYGYQTHGETANPSVLEDFLNKNKIGRGVEKGFKLEEKIFEDPLFKVRLPAAKARVLRENYDRLLPKVGEEQALRQASTIANDFMGGINKSLRNKTYQDLLQVGILAPDWAESRINLAVKGAKALVGKADPIYAKALGRGLVMRGAGAATAGYLGNKIGSKPSDLTSVGLGETKFGKIREAPIYGTATEGLRIPEQAIRGAYAGDLSPVTKIVKNRMSTPAQSVINTVLNQDAYGNPLSGPDKYGRPTPIPKTLMNYADQITQSIQPQQLQALIGYLQKKQGGEEAISQGLELPLTYASQKKFGRARRRVRTRSR